MHALESEVSALVKGKPVEEIPEFAETKYGFRCMGQTCFADGRTRTEAEREWRRMMGYSVAHLKRDVDSPLILLRLLRRLK